MWWEVVWISLPLITYYLLLSLPWLTYILWKIVQFTHEREQQFTRERERGGTPAWYCALHDGVCKSCCSCNMSIPSQFPGLDYREEVIVWSSGRPDSVPDVFVCDSVSKWDAKDLPVTSHFEGLDPSFQFSCEGPCFIMRRGRLMWLLNEVFGSCVWRWFFCPSILSWA